MPLPADLAPWATGNYGPGGDSWSATARRVVAGQVGFAALGLTPNLKTDAQTFNEWLGRVQEWVEYLRTEQGAGLFGDGSDGPVTDSVNRTLSRVHYYTDWTIDTAAVVTTAGYPVFVNGTLTLDSGILDWSGAAGATSAGGGAGGIGSTSTVNSGGESGGDGTNTNGNPGVSSATSINTGSGGLGGTGGGGVPGAGGTSVLAVGDGRSVNASLLGQSSIVSGLTPFTAGSGGGAGAGIPVLAVGGGGGAGAGTMLIVARTIVLVNAGAITMAGGAGGAGSAADAAGGGGGGQGGIIRIVRREIDTSGGTISAAGGAAGAAGGGGGGAGVVGDAGTVLQLG